MNDDVGVINLYRCPRHGMPVLTDSNGTEVVCHHCGSPVELVRPGITDTDDIATVREALIGSVLGGYLSRQEAGVAALDRLAARLKEYDSLWCCTMEDRAAALAVFNEHEDRMRAAELRAKEAERERDEARVVAKRMSRTPVGEFEELKARAEAAELRVAALQDGLALYGRGLAVYGRHLRRCTCSKWTPEDNYQPVCDCGLDALLAGDGAA